MWWTIYMFILVFISWVPSKVLKENLTNTLGQRIHCSSLQSIHYHTYNGSLIPETVQGGKISKWDSGLIWRLEWCTISMTIWKWSSAKLYSKSPMQRKIVILVITASDDGLDLLVAGHPQESCWPREDHVYAWYCNWGEFVSTSVYSDWPWIIHYHKASHGKVCECQIKLDKIKAFSACA